MKIGIISNLYPPYAQGGAEIIAETMVTALKKTGQDVFVMTTVPYTSLRSLQTTKREQAGVSIYAWYPLNLYHYAQGHRKLWLVRAVWHALDIANIHSYLQAKKVFQIERPDMVITHNLMGIGFLIPRLLRRLNIRHVHVLHDVQLYNPSGLIRFDGERSLAQLFYTLIGYPASMRRLFNAVSLIVSPSHFLLDFYKRRGFFAHTKTQVIPNPISFSGSKQHHPSQDSVRLLYVGQISEIKGAVGLVNTVARLKDMAVSLTLIGDGSDAEYIQAKAEASAGRITFLGRLPHASLPEHFASADIVVAPTLCYDNFPTIVAESLRCSVPVIVSDCGGAKEIVQDSVNGWIMPAGDWQYLESLIKKLVEDHSVLVKAASHGEASVAHLTLDRYSDELLKALRT
jgi:glycosyltransferase involved in cell wall biosynthesis